jgi:glutamate carboxypeptidase
MSELLEDVLQRTEVRIAEIMPLLETWVRRNSYSADVDGVNAMGELLAEAFSLPGLKLERHAGKNVGDHLVWTTPAWAGGGSERLLLLGHHDTVFPPGTFDAWELDGDRLRGPGVLDMKGGLGTVRAAVAVLSDCGLLEKLPLAVVSVGDEEIGSIHSAPLLQEVAAGASAALVFEAGRAQDMIITQRKGTGGIKVVAHGKAAHAGNHHRQGKNAIWALAKLIDAAQKLTNYDEQVTVNVGLVSGGEAKNTVPGLADCVIDFRFVTAEAGEAVVSSLKTAASEICDATGVTFEFDGGIRRLPLVRTDSSAALCTEYGACAAEEGMGNSEAGLLGGGSDANTVSAVGVPAIDGLGPRGAGFHTHNEYIEVSSLAMRTRALVRFLCGRLS